MAPALANSKPHAPRVGHKIDLHISLQVTVTEVAENEGSGDDVTATGEFSMPPDTTQTTVSPSLCLERGKRYKIKFTFDQYDPNTPKATINIDAVRLACI